MKLRWRGRLVAVGLMGLAGPAMAEIDWLGMANQYGNNAQNIMRNEAFNHMRNNTIAQQRGAQPPQRNFGWPRHIDAASVQRGHVFTVGELEAMFRSDPARTRQLLHGRQVTVQGMAEWRRFQGNPRGVLRLNPEVGREYFVSVRGDLPRTAFDSGDRIRLQGMAEYDGRRNHVTLQRSRLVAARVPKTGPRTAAAPAPASAPAQAPAVDRAALTANPSTGPRTAGLKFKPNPAVRQRANELLVERLTPALRQGVTPAQLRQALERGDAQQAFARVSRQHGFAVNDLGDVLTVATVLGWQVANDRPQVDEPAGYRALRRDLGRALSQAKWVERMDDEQKQMVAELTGTGIMVIAARYHEGRTQGQPALVRQAGEDARQFLRELTGLDVSQMELTAQGLVRG